MTTHAQLSPSKRARWAVCPGSIREEAKLPKDDRSSPSAIDGTHTHTVLEKCIKAGMTDPMGMIGITMSDHDGTFTVDRARAERVKLALDYLITAAAYLGGEVPAQVISETRVNPAWFTSRDDLSGTVDAQIRGRTTLEIVDYKDGISPVAAENNLQLEQYAIGVLAECGLGTNVPEQYPWSEVRMTIIQPKLALKGMNPITTWTVPVKYLLDRVQVLSAEARATDDPNAPLVPGEKQCRYCPARGACAASASSVIEKVGIMFPSITETPATVDPLDLAHQSASKDPATMDNHQLCQIIEAAPMLRQLLEAADAEALRRMQAGQTIPGLKMVNGRGSRVWNLPEEQMAEKLVKMGIPKGSIYETKLVSPAKAEKLAWEKRDGTKVQLTDRQLKRMDQEYVSRLAGKLTVAHESDPRPAVITNAAPMFAPVVNQVQESVVPVLDIPDWLR